MTRLPRLFGMVIIGLGLVGWRLPALTWAASGDAATSRETADEDFAWMGEFLTLNPTSNEQPMGLQLIAHGGGKFQAALLRGGLPGNGWDTQHRWELQGERSDASSSLELSGDDYRVVIEGVKGQVFDAQGNVVSSLRKVNRRSRMEGLQPPAYSIVLFDGHDTRAFKNPTVKDGLLQVGTELLPTYRNFRMHVEFLVPYMPQSTSQGRGNSGVYLQSRYEVQILDSFGLKGAPNECGGLYRQRAPLLNMALPPLTWQTYDLEFHAPLFDHHGEKVRNARLTVLHNGVVIHDDIEILTKTGAGKPEGPTPLPIKLQDHGNPVQFRNIWLVELP